MGQYALPLPHAPVFSADNFFISGCNREALQWINAWPDWPQTTFYLSGPGGSGKSHLGQIWAARAQAQAVGAQQWTLDADRMAPLLLENIEHAASEPELFHLLNLMHEKRLPLLLTASVPAKDLPFTLPDLTSRLRALPAAAIAAPDDEALLGAMRKQFADRQLAVPEEVLSYLLPRMERSFTAAAAMVEQLDRQALAHKKTLTVPFVRQLLGY